MVASGEPLVELGDPAQLEVVADYLSREAVAIRAGLPVRIERWGGEGALEGRVRRVEPAGFTKVSALGVEEKRVNVVIDLVSPPEDRPSLGDGYRVETRVVVAELEDALQVPSGSLFRKGAGWAVFVIEDGRARLREVETGERTPAAVAIRGGLEEGVQVITHPGDAVSPRRPGGGASRALLTTARAARRFASSHGASGPAPASGDLQRRVSPTWGPRGR